MKGIFKPILISKYQLKAMNTFDKLFGISNKEEISTIVSDKNLWVSGKTGYLVKKGYIK